jgi:glycosyltransferase family protein
MKLPKRVYRHFERKNYEKGRYSNKLNILNTEETLKLLENQKVSFLRYGDGELAIINGNSIPFQEYNEELSKRLREFIGTRENNLKIGIPYYYMNPLKNLNPFVSSFASSLAPQRKFLCRECRKDIEYIDTAITQVYQTYSDYDFKNYYSRMQALLRDKDVTIVCGEGVLDRLEYKAFDECNSVEFVYAPSMNAFSKYNEILGKVLKTDKDRLVCIVLGPTAKVLVYDLHQKGYQAWDIGHYFKDYDAYMKKRPRTEAEITQFYKPD